MNLNSLFQRLTNQWIISLRAYPLAHLMLLFITVVISMMVEADSGSVSMDILSKCLIIGATVLPLSVIRPQHKRQLGLILAAIAYYFVLPPSIQNSPYAQGIIIVGTGIIAWLVPALVIVYEHQSSQDQTWSELGHWWSSLAQGLIAGAIVRAGISASLASIEFLFDVTISSDIYQHIGNISMILIAGWIALINLLQTHTLQYPRRMRVFGQYIFLPLCIIYGLILISYGVKIIVTGVWPEGQLIYMVSGYVIFGLLTWMALLPLSSTESRVSTMYRVLFGSFVITTGLMIGAIYIRLEQYGLTIDRYLVISLIAWIVVMGGGGMIWPLRRWMIGIGSFVIILALSIYTGPISATGSTYRYHAHNINQGLANAANSYGDPTTLYQSLDYLARNYGTGWTSDFFDPSQTIQRSGSNSWDLASNIMTTLNLTGYSNNGYYDNNDYVYFNSYTLGSISVEGYRELVQFDSYRDNTSKFITIEDNSTISINTGTINTKLNIINDLEKITTMSKDNSDPYIITQSGYKLIITNLNAQKFSDKTTLQSIAGYILIK